MPGAENTIIAVENLGRLRYAPAYHRQQQALERVLGAREDGVMGPRLGGCILVVEHEPVITLSRRAAQGPNLLASREQLDRLGVELCETDRGGDITYHGPGQVVIYPIIDLNLFGFGVHDYMRTLEQAVIDACARWGIRGERDPQATGVWVRVDPASGRPQSGGTPAKLCAFGVRVRKWVSMHGLAINVTTNLSHFDLIVPCGLAGRSVTSLEALLGSQTPSFSAVTAELTTNLERLLRQKLAARHPAAPTPR